MGCGASKEDIAAFEAMRDRCQQLELDNAELDQNILLLEKKISDNEVKNKEQLNLYRFKIEVLTNMLSVEERKLESTVKRLETLKLAMLTQGFTDKAMNNLLRTKSTPGNKKDDEQNILMTSAFDMSGAINRLTEEMEQGHAEDIIYAFANKQGKLVSHISRDDFSRYLYNVTETLSKSDVQILSLRFYDGSTVCVPEFIDFFTSSQSTRVARAAASAVRVSLNMLQLEVEDVPAKDEVTVVEEINLVKDPSTNMKNLQHAVEKLIAIWEEVEESLIEEFMCLEEEVGGNQIVQFDTFEEILDTFCGSKKATEERKHRRKTGDKWLSSEDINFIACRFEIGDRIDVKQFFNFFQDANYSNNKLTPAAAPFQFSKEWSTLRQSAQQDLVSGKKNIIAEDNDEKDFPTTDDEKSEEPAVDVVPKVKFKSGPKKEKETPKPVVTKKDVEKKPVQVDKKLEKPVAVTKKEIDKPKLEAKPKTVKSEKEEIPVQETKVFNNTLVALYANDPEKFENNLEKKSSKTGFIMTKDEFRITLKAHTSGESIADSDIDNVLSKLKFIGGTCSVSDLVQLLKASVEEVESTPPPKTKTKDNSTADDKLKPLELLPTGPIINVRQEHIKERLDELREAKLDTITTEYNANSKEFLKTLKVSTVNKKGDVDGTGNSITSASFKPVMRDLVPKATRQEVDALEHELQPSVKKDTNDIPLSAITSVLKSRTKEFNSTASNIKKQEKLLAEEEKRNVRIEERTAKINELTSQVETDSISDQYFVDPKLFMTNLKTGREGKSMLMTDLVSYMQDNIPNITKAENDKFKEDLLAADKKLNVKDQYLHVSFASVEKILKQRVAARTKLLKQIDKEKNILQKDLDKANSIEDASGGGCCGGGGGNVHDPNTAPQDLPPEAKIQKSETSLKNKDSTIQKGDDDDPSESKPEAYTRRRSSSSADDNNIGDDFSEDNNEDLPRYNPKSRVLKSSLTTDTLTYSDNGDEKSVDSGMNDERRGDDKIVNRRPLSMNRGGRSNNKFDSGRGFSKPRDVDETKTQSDGSDDDSLIFGSMKKK